MSTRPILHISTVFISEMIEHAHAEQPNECCGLLVGRIVDGDYFAEMRLPLVNALQSPTRFESEPRSMMDAWKQIRASKLEVLAVYHSHPSSPPIPSLTDLANNHWGETVACVIVSGNEVRGWWLTEFRCQEAEIRD